MEQIHTFHALLPSISKDVDMYPHSRDLGDKLGQILELYLDFCIAIVRHFSRNPASTFCHISLFCRWRLGCNPGSRPRC